jgi:hypothetical protein
MNGGATGESPESETGQEIEQPDQQDQGEGTPDQQEAAEDDRFATTIRFRGELAKPNMTGEGTEDELTVKVKVAGFDLADLHHSLRPYAGRVVEAIILPIKTAEEKAPWETPDPDQQQLAFGGDRPEGDLVCVGCGRSYDMATEGTCPECGGMLNPREQTSATDGASAAGGAAGEDGQQSEEDTPA